jgi:hypothetical protein
MSEITAIIAPLIGLAAMLAVSVRARLIFWRAIRHPFVGGYIGTDLATGKVVFVPYEHVGSVSRLP